MKRLKIAVIALFALVMVSNINAQDENNPWAVSFGVNSVDMYHGTDFSSQFNDMLSNDDWNILPSISRIAADRYLGKGFSVQLAGSLNKITHHLAEDDSDYLLWSIGAMAKYDLNNLFGDTGWFDPYIGLGGDFVDSGYDGGQSELMGHGALGFNIWMNENLGLNFQHGSKLGFAENVRSHYQNSISLIIKFGGTDTDGDGVYDQNDACPEVAGLEEFNGCPDADGDGVKDSDDACPEVPGLVAMNGCPDADGDGVADKDDMCPNEKGTKANKGCPDADGDGVVGKDDKCPTVAGPAANNGCPWPDTDGDGVLDKDDNCKNEAGPASNSGCPEPPKSYKELIGADTFKDILFNTNRASFKSGVTKQLDGMISVMNEFEKAEFDINGYADSTGTKAYNLMLSDKRANAVKNYFVKKGINESRLTAKGFGEENPVDTNSTRKGRANNRRVEVKVKN